MNLQICEKLQIKRVSFTIFTKHLIFITWPNIWITFVEISHCLFITSTKNKQTYILGA